VRDSGEKLKKKKEEKKEGLIDTLYVQVYVPRAQFATVFSSRKRLISLVPRHLAHLSSRGLSLCSFPLP
jgi:hypothetical protein